MAETTFRKSTFREYFESLVVAVILAMFVRTFGFQAFKIPTGSMEPNLLVGDHLLVNKFIFGPAAAGVERALLPMRDVERGEVLVFKFPEEPERDFIKRVIGLPGETLELRDQTDLHQRRAAGRALRALPAAGAGESGPGDVRRKYGPVTIPAGHYFMMGDNRDDSQDSRYWGFLPATYVKGRALFIYWSFGGPAGHEVGPAAASDSLAMLPPATRLARVRDVALTVTTEAPDYSGFWSRMEAGAWEPETLDLLDRLLAPGDQFVDVGAWIGPTTLYAAARGARVAAYECDPVALRLLRRNVALNPGLAPLITLHEYALGESDGRLTLWSEALGNSETSIFAEHEREDVVRACEQSVAVEVRDARAVFDEAGYASGESTLIKIDVEGAEFRILPRLAGVAAASRAVWYVSFHERNVNPAGTAPGRWTRASCSRIRHSRRERSHAPRG